MAAKANADDHIYNENLKELQRCMGVMFNNKLCSNTIFTIKETKFYALSYLIGTCSPTLDSMIRTHYKHCKDRDIKLNDVKQEESFSIILRYMYGLQINFSQTKLSVLCEVLDLSERYQLTTFHADLKVFISAIDSFHIDSLAVLLNTAKKFNMTELYEKLSIHAYLNAEEFVTHGSIVDLQYDVLMDLLKSDWLFAEEINILRGALNWHSDMYKSESKRKESLVKENDIEDVIEEQDVSSDIQSDASDCETDLAESIDTLSLDEDDSKKENLHDENSHLEEGAEFSGEDVNESKSMGKVDVSEKTDKCNEVVKTFSESVLKSLLPHIRISRISFLDVMKASKTELFKPYSDYVFDDENFSQSKEPRRKYIETSVSSNNVQQDDIQECDVSVPSTRGVQDVIHCDVTCRFTVIVHVESIMYESKEEHLLEDLKWKMCGIITLDHQNDNTYIYKMYLQCTSDEQSDWKCTAECQLKWISHDPRHNTMIFPYNNSYTSLTLTAHNCSVEIARYEKCSDDSDYDTWPRAFEPNDMLTFELHIKFLTKKVIK